MIFRRVCTLLVVTLVVLASGCWRDRYYARHGCCCGPAPCCGCSASCCDPCACGSSPISAVAPLPMAPPPVLVPSPVSVGH